MTILRRLAVVLAFTLGATAACGDDSANAVTRLHVDLGAVVAQGKVQPVEGITAAGQPNEAALQVFAEQGYVAVIDLRTAGENRGMDEPAVVQSLGMEYVSLPIGIDDVTLGSARELQALLGKYEGPVLVHCASSNRVGALLALSKADGGADTEAALAYGRSAGLRSLEGKVREALDEN